MLRIVPANGFTSEQLREAMQDAFSDYAVPLTLSAQAFDLMMRQRGLDPASSRVALLDGQMAAIWLTAVRGSEAYLISSGTRPAFRSRGIARALAEDCIAGLSASGVHSLQTEVLRTNETAAGLYYSLGMTRTRLLDCYAIPERTEVSGPPADLSLVDWPALRHSVAELRDWRPSWQNDDLSLDAIADQLLCVVSSDGAGVAGFGVATRETGAVHQIAVRRDARRRGIGEALVRTIQFHLQGRPLSFINVQQDDVAFRALMDHVGAEADSRTV